jgi:hypothetical protein
LLGLELRDGALDGVWGMIAPSGAAARGSKPRPVGKARNWPLTPLDLTG